MKRLILIYCIPFIGCAGPRAASNVDLNPGTDVTRVWTASLVPRGDFQLRGSARAQARGVVTRVAITISNARGGRPHPWRVHSGTCADPGSIVGTGNRYSSLEVGSNGPGSATSLADLDIALDDDGQYSVSVLKSSSEMSVIIACGDLRR